MIYDQNADYNEQDDGIDQEPIMSPQHDRDQHSVISVSTCELPSPALSARNSEMVSATQTITEKVSEKSWIWRWADKVTDGNGINRVYCKVKPCSKKKGWALVNSSTSNIIRHLKTEHKLDENTTSVNLKGQAGSIEGAFATQGKRSRAHFTSDELERQVCKMLVRNQLPFTLGGSTDLQRLLELAHAAPSIEDLKLPSNDTLSRR
ncbi:hypothetical protein BGX27_004778, partial [Mortierella sp. AM989]